MRIVRTVVAAVAALVMLVAVGGTAAGDPPGMTHNSFEQEMTHN